MEKPVESSLRRTVIWSYERGTLPYDIICGLILAFIFFVPRSCFIKPRAEIQKSRTQTIVVPPPGTASQSAPAAGTAK